MIHISDLTKKIYNFLKNKGEDKFKIFVRINFSIETYIFTEKRLEAENYQKEFLNTLSINNVPNVNDNEFDDFYMKNIESLKVKFITIDKSEAESDPYYINMFSASNDIIDWGPRYRFDSLLRNKEQGFQQEKVKQAPVVTFYSYKGGMGRTTTMVAYALSLATNKDVFKKKRVVIIDCDLEAPGYLNFFDLSEHAGLIKGEKNGLVEFLSDSQLTKVPENLDINNYIINVGLDNKNSFSYNNLDNIWLVPAGNLNESLSDYESDTDRNDYLEGLAKINLSSIPNVINGFNLLLNKINETIKPDIILLDSRTGFNDIFGTAALYLSSCVVGFFGFSRQTQPGLIKLLKDYYKSNNDFHLELVFSILPEDVSDDWLQMHQQQILGYLNHIGTEDKSLPSFMYLHRNPILEKIGTGDEQSDIEFVKLVQTNKFVDYNNLFEKINSRFFDDKNKSLYTADTPSLQLRNVVLKHLKDVLVNVSNFAEDTRIEEDQFFYRECMKELFEQKKFIIQGYKGTGKTYLYKALAEPSIALNIQKWVGRTGNDVLDPIFVTILPTIDTALVFENIRYGSLEEPEFYFNTFWQVYTWNVLLLKEEFSSILDQSELKEYVKPVEGAGYAKEALVRIDNLINMGVNVLIVIENDIIKINEYLKEKNKRLFVLYDRLDTCINPLRWNKAVSPLINYWRNNCETFSNIAPKIFVRTDLFKQIEGTNTARLENSIIHIEWSIGEVFGFFFKLIFSNKRASDAYWAIAEKVGIDSSYIKNTKKSFDKFPYNQFKSLRSAEMIPIIKVFFGKIVQVGVVTLGTPWVYFEKELSNADNTAISLRPFINTLDCNAVDKALAKTEKYVHNGIISSEIYASKSVRDDTTDKYFDDLTQDAFSKDLLRFRDVIRNSGGEKFRYKSLKEDLFEELINTTYERIIDSDVVKCPDDLKRLVFANGIMAAYPTRKGKFYRFAPIYHYSWGLANSAIENEEKKKVKKGTIICEGQRYEGRIVECKKTNGGLVKKVYSEIFPRMLWPRNTNFSELVEDDVVTFVARKEPNKYNPQEDFWYADDIQIKEDC